MRTRVRIEPGDCREIVPCLAAEGVVVDAVVTDPPYHLIEASRGGSARQNDPSKPFGRAEARGGFMGQRWDGGDVAFRPETWATIATVLRPGGFLLAFGGTRTFDRVWGAIREGGLIVQDTILWLYGSGFPKRRDLLKPAWEPICVAYKPGGKRTLQVDECRVPGTNPSPDRRQSARRNGNAPGRPGKYGHTITDRITPERYMAEHDGESLGRWPANVAHDGGAEVVEAFAAFGDTQRGHFPVARGRSRITTVGHVGQTGLDESRGDTGSAARFFYCAKADDEDRWGSRHPTVKPVELLKWLVPLVTPPRGTFLDPFSGSGTSGVAALATGRNAILIEQDAGYIADIRERIAFYEGTGRHSLVSRNRQTKPRGDVPLFVEA
jgi:site-specific DNA-methyltransferase (adenine-specific)